MQACGMAPLDGTTASWLQLGEKHGGYRWRTDVDRSAIMNLERFQQYINPQYAVPYRTWGYVQVDLAM